MIGTTLKAWNCIQIKQGRTWTFLGDENGIMNFETPEARDAKIAELESEHNDSSSATSAAS